MNKGTLPLMVNFIDQYLEVRGTDCKKREDPPTKRVLSGGYLTDGG